MTKTSTARRVITAPSEERRQTIATLTAAFVDDPFVRWLYPDPAQYLAHFPEFAARFGGAAFEQGTAYRSDDFAGASLWLPPGVEPDEDGLVGHLVATADPALHESVFAALEETAKYHPQGASWYLPLIGVDPLRQGRGYGSALLEHALERCDADGVPAYLESSKDRNIPLYERFGFRVLGEVQVGSAPPFWPMLRAARAA